ncbi:MAG: hypothetical protein RJA87_517 [Pseudomonadota bacterium]
MTLSRRLVLGTIASTLALPALARTPLPVVRRLIAYGNGRDAQPIELEVLLRGRGPLVVLIASLGRGASDFDDLAERIARAGFQAAAINPRGVERSRGPAAKTMDDYAMDVSKTIEALHPGPGGVVLIGHAFGNRVARATAAAYPDRVSGLILLASGGQVPIAPNINKALLDVFDVNLTPQDHMTAVKTAFFAPGNDPDIWREGWYPAVAMEQRKVLANTPADRWTGAGSAKMLIIQAADDAIAPPANAEALRSAHPDRVTVATIRQAGHAMLPEQPDEIARIVIERLKRGA